VLGTNKRPLKINAESNFSQIIAYLKTKLTVKAIYTTIQLFMCFGSEYLCTSKMVLPKGTFDESLLYDR